MSTGSAAADLLLVEPHEADAELAMRLLEPAYSVTKVCRSGASRVERMITSL